MNSKAMNLFRNFSYSITSNLVSLLISTLIILVVPKLVGLKEYGYWQLYLFYGSYVGLMHLGWVDGIYLRYGGQEYKEIDKRTLFSQFYMLVAFQLILGVAIIIFAMYTPLDKSKNFILHMVVMNMFIMNIYTLLQLVLQATNRIREYAFVEMLGRISYLLMIIIMLVIGLSNYKLIILADIFGKFVSLCLSLYYFRDILILKTTSFYFSFKETFLNINVGIKLMIANLSSMLIVGVIRYGIEHSWNVETFGKVSLTLSASNLMMLFINAVGIIVFPILRRTDEEKLPRIYMVMRTFLMVILLGLLIIYYPLKSILSVWLPNYSDSLLYMALVFPMFIYEGKMALLINTYLKALRKEKLMLRINIMSLILSVIVTFITTQIFSSLDIAILSIVVLLAFRCTLAEIYLSKILNLSVLKNIFLELILSVAFILSSWFVNSWVTVLLYVLAYLFYLLIKKNEIIKSIKFFKLFIKA